MIDSDQVHLWAYKNFIFQGYATPVHEFATMVDENVFADPNVFAEVCVEGWQHPQRRVHWHANKLSEQVPNLLRCAVPGIDFRNQFLSFGNEVRDLAVFRIVERDDL